ncbi:MAG: ribonuclease III [Proteobacteria bacterium]|nr:ribonuclease III [Pseudomonadota bacterium]
MVADLAAILEYEFSDTRLLVEALTHRSVEGASGGDHTGNYERLEFLGDRVLGLIIADLLIAEFPNEAEGALAMRFAALARRESLALVARESGLAPHIRLSVSEDESGGRENDTILADVCEAVLGALYIEGGLAPARAFIERHFMAALHATVEPPQDPKTCLQEWAQGLGHGLPVYRLVLREGPDHVPEFTVSVSVAAMAPSEGIGSSKRMAEQAAAKLFLERLSDC